VLLLLASKETVLLPWDESLARAKANADVIVPFTKFDRNAIKAVQSVLSRAGAPKDCRVELPPATPYPAFLSYVEALEKYSVLCRDRDGAHAETARMRAVKDERELSCIEKAAEITDGLIDAIERMARAGEIETETDAALFIERECRAAGCEGTSFPTLAAGPARSFGIHAFPAYTAGAFPAEGISLLDFGVLWDGYASDVTVTLLKGGLSEAQEKQVALMEKAYAAALPLYKPGAPVAGAARKVNAVYGREKRELPHGLGHGVGLAIHEYPSVRTSAPDTDVFLPGMVVTLEPGLYDASLGGCRFENDVLITENGNRVLTHSRVIRL
jgi:Xaa-Pro dipeptidase